ncbi:MAG: hypothetical protein V1777_01010 [Candidatus Micrarchaeota archaeon]
MAHEIKELSYDEIRRIYRLEKNTSKLVELPEEFYNLLNDFVQEQKEKYIKNLKDFSIEEARDFANLKKMIEEIFVLRERKILNAALIASRSGDNPALQLATPEKKVFDSVVSMLEKQHGLLTDMFCASGGSSKKESKSGRSLETVAVKILTEVPAFIGTDMNEYGPFSQNQQVELPFKVAKLFFDRKLGEPGGED